MKDGFLAALLLLGATLAPATPSATPAERERVWFVNNAAPDRGDGSREAPFQRLKEAEAVSGPGDTLFVFAGDGSDAGLDEGIVLKDGQVVGRLEPKGSADAALVATGYQELAG